MRRVHPGVRIDDPLAIPPSLAWIATEKGEAYRAASENSGHIPACSEGETSSRV